MARRGDREQAVVAYKLRAFVITLERLENPLELETSFPHEYLAQAPAICQVRSPEKYIPAPPRLVVEVRDSSRRTWSGVFAGAQDQIFEDGLFSTPDPDSLCVVAGGAGYFLEASDPQAWIPVACDPVRHVLPISDEGILVFGDFSHLVAYEYDGESADIRLKERWRSARLGWDCLEVSGIANRRIEGRAWHAPDDRTVGFTVDVQTGAHEGGAFGE